MTKAYFGMRRDCTACKGHLAVIGQQRKNGKQSHVDWLSRSSHKACWKRCCYKKSGVKCYHCTIYYQTRIRKNTNTEV